MKRQPSLLTAAMFSCFALGFSVSLLVAVIDPQIAEVMSWVALLHGCLALLSLGAIVYEVTR